MFYFESRGISRDAAENILSRASIERLARVIGDQELQERIIHRLDKEL